MTRFFILICACASLTAPTTGQVPTTVDPEIKAAIDRIDAGEIEKTVRKLVTFGTRHTMSDTRSETRGIGAARRWLKSRMDEIAKETGGNLKVAMERHTLAPTRRLPQGGEVVNVVATLPGTDPNRYVIISGHYDSRASRGGDSTSDAPGANDDGSGTAVVLEAARALGHLKPRATILFMCVAGEEQGLLGAAAHAKMAREEKRRIEAMITNDIVGGVRGSSGKQEPMRVRLFSEGNPSGPVGQNGRPTRRVVGSDNDSPSRQLARYLAARGEAYTPGFEVTMIFRQDRYLRGGDHKAFNTEGFAGVRFTECHENFDWQHQDVREKDGRKFGDVPENLDYDYIARVCRTNAAGAAEIALAPASVRQVRVLVARLTPHTELAWQASEAEDLAGYAVVYRRTHEPTWTHRKLVDKSETSVVMEGLSKDDWLFGVQAYDEKGRYSVPVYPTPSYGRRRGR